MAVKVVPETQVVFEPSENSYRADTAEAREAKRVAAYRQQMAQTILEEMRRQNAAAAAKPPSCWDKCVIL